MESEFYNRGVRRARRAKGVRKSIRGTAQKPRLSVSKTNKHLFAQLIDDENRITIAGVGTVGKNSPFGKRSKDAAKKIGMRLAEIAKEKQIEKAVFDRGFYKYHGLIAEIANGAREVGLKI